MLWRGVLWRAVTGLTAGCGDDREMWCNTADVVLNMGCGVLTGCGVIPRMCADCGMCCADCKMWCEDRGVLCYVVS